MTDENDIFEEETAAEPEQANAAPEFDDELAEILDDLGGTGAFDPSQVITITSTTGARAAVPASEPLTISAVLRAAGLTASHDVQYYVGNNAVGVDYVVAPGGQITAVGVVKGG